MEIEKAIELFENCDTVTFTATGCGEETHKTVEFKDVVQALEKQVAKKVIVKDWSPAKCPTCGIGLSELIGDGYYEHFTWIKRCPNPDCAQLLKWEDEDD